MQDLIPDIVGSVGVAIIVLTYLLLQMSVLKIEGIIYSSANALSSLLVLYSLYYHWNLSAVLVEVFWCGISLYGTVKVLMLKRKAE